ncbi:hypothetical protein CesoFtcFv8_016138 [Champsocephalus esox]|uniref:Uncharacterized protein n=2 Tax=Champsocephalus TaxID=52236 RepID=A0AAN8D9C9_CHAGU|nr:hypothetical protein CesoFtcFv8_016138 [Champsocephalus esox]KAK5917999.1 hypothetical protein CgunFtcFv8_002803 [Champsocephalus gunnari]
MLQQDSGTPSLPRLCLLQSESRAAACLLEEPLGPKANEPWTRPLWPCCGYQRERGWGGTHISLSKGAWTSWELK